MYAVILLLIFLIPTSVTSSSSDVIELCERGMKSREDKVLDTFKQCYQLEMWQECIREAERIKGTKDFRDFCEQEFCKHSIMGFYHLTLTYKDLQLCKPVIVGELDYHYPSDHERQLPERAKNFLYSLTMFYLSVTYDCLVAHHIVGMTQRDSTQKLQQLLYEVCRYCRKLFESAYIPIAVLYRINFNEVVSEVRNNFDPGKHSSSSWVVGFEGFKCFQSWKDKIPCFGKALPYEFNVVALQESEKLNWELLQREHQVAKDLSDVWVSRIFDIVLQQRTSNRAAWQELFGKNIVELVLDPVSSHSDN